MNFKCTNSRIRIESNTVLETEIKNMYIKTHQHKTYEDNTKYVSDKLDVKQQMVLSNNHMKS